MNKNTNLFGYLLLILPFNLRSRSSILLTVVCNLTPPVSSGPSPFKVKVKFKYEMIVWYQSSTGTVLLKVTNNLLLSDGLCSVLILLHLGKKE